ncbi:MAG TPA: diol dehydratase reactivase ATPase-like domain-containing protein [Candidatus Nanopelagicales bacterium]|nr:diol dehydratase reactivase ATPase-like domain-containing protein [Candidatus Nanopelagicales bacterium]
MTSAASSLVAGLDVGNSTTEVVIVDVSVMPPRPVAWDRRPTRGRKGSERSWRGAAELLVRLEARSGVRAGAVVVTRQHPVDTRAALLAEPEPDTGRLRVLAAGAATPGTAGIGVGRPVECGSDAVADGPVVLVAADPLGYRRTAADVERWQRAGAEVVGVVVAGDEAVLVSRRLSRPVPVVDGVDPGIALTAQLLAVEVARPGAAVRSLCDPVRTAALFGLGPEEHAHAEAVARSVRGLGDVVVALVPSASPPAAGAPVALVEGPAGRVALLDAVGGTPWPVVDRVVLPGDDGALVASDVDDAWAVDLDRVASDVVLRPRATRSRAVALALLATPGDDDIDTEALLGPVLGRPVHVVHDEAAAARAGALTTPGADPGATVVDVGGGTIDVVVPGVDAVVLAGAGDLVTLATAELLQLPRGQAEWVKRGPSSRVEGPHLVADEDGQRRFLDAPAAAAAVGRLVVPGPAGLLAFSAVLAPAEWRALRLRLKSAVLGDNVARGAGAAATGDVLVVGGPGGDDEVLDCVARALPGAVPGRGDVAGVLGHRWAVAYGLTVLLAR